MPRLAPETHRPASENLFYSLSSKGRALSALRRGSRDRQIFQPHRQLPANGEILLDLGLSRMDMKPGNKLRPRPLMKLRPDENSYIL